MSSAADRIRRTLGDGARAETASPRRALREVESEGAGTAARIDPRLRARLEALGVAVGIGPGSQGPSVRHRPHEDDADLARTDLEPPASPDDDPWGRPLAGDARLDALVRGFERETPFGPFLQVERRYSLGACHGRVPLAAALEHAVPLRPHERGPDAAGRGEATLDPSKAVFIDTETTGLSGGTGTVAFLVGAGRVEDGAFVVRQYCMRDYPEEPALLYALAHDLGDAPLVSFNGRSFDWPLLTTRWRLHRTRPSARTHLDLLHTARRLWARTLHSHSLGALERHVLGMTRGEDLPGWRIPSAYFEFLRDGNAATVAAAFRHNEIDVVSMLALLGCVAETLHDPTGRVASPGDRLGTARLLLDLRQPDRARRCLEAGLEAADGDEARPLARLLGTLCRRAGDYGDSLRHWKSVAENAPELDVEAYEHVAKIYEHRLRDFGEALRWTRDALARTEPGSPPEAALRHREARLVRRIERSASRPQPSA